MGQSVLRIGLAKIKRGRFVSLQASFDGGMVLTKPLITEGVQLYLNANAAFGTIRVTVLDEQGVEIPGFQTAVAGADDIMIPVEFQQGTLKDLAGKNIRI